MKSIVFWVVTLAASAGLIFGLEFDPEDGGDTFLRNVGITPNYAALQHKSLYS
jgi:hypothetical protein